MKRTFLFLMALVAIAVGIRAQGQTATLQQGDKMTPFYGEDAFVQAYNAAQKGAVITLSAGEFNTVDSITKQVTIIGNGCANVGQTNQTWINAKAIAHLGSNGLSASLIINANSVTIEGCDFQSSVWIRNVSNTHIKRCNLFHLNAAHTHKNTIVDQCYVNYNYTLAKAENMCFKNSFIVYLNGNEVATLKDYEKLNTSSNPAYFSNCLIYHWRDVAQVTSNTYATRRFTPYGTYKNCILGQRSYIDGASNDRYWRGYYMIPNYYSYTGMEYYNNVFFLYPYQFEKDASGNWVDEVYEDLKN